MSFAGIRGQDRAVAFLKGTLASGRTSHAYIFYGPRGTGKMLAAVTFAKALTCASDGERPCDVCVSCKKIGAASHPDVLVVKPAADAKSIGIDDIRALIGDISLKPYEAKKKVYIIDQVGVLTDQAANALLKTLEEPPTDSVLILIVENLATLLPTIVSRSQVVKFFPLAADAVKDILVRFHGVEDRQAHILARLGSGSVGEALAYKNEKAFEKRVALIKALADGTFFDQDLDKVPKAELKAILTIMLTWYRDLMVAKAAGAAAGETLVNIDARDAIAREAAGIGFDRLDRMIKQIISTGSFLEQNVNPKLAMAALGITI